ncbi:hypothetical protein ACFL17_05100 [Pseudomonadota bacterium]
MKKFIFGLFIGVIVGWPIGINMGRGVPILSNPFQKTISQNLRETTEAVKKTTSKMVQDTKKTINEATK